jgi:hypothetical protein
LTASEKNENKEASNGSRKSRLHDGEASFSFAMIVSTLQPFCQTPSILTTKLFSYGLATVCARESSKMMGDKRAREQDLKGARQSQEKSKKMHCHSTDFRVNCKISCRAGIESERDLQIKLTNRKRQLLFVSFQVRLHIHSSEMIISLSSVSLLSVQFLSSTVTDMIRFL